MSLLLAADDVHEFHGWFGLAQSPEESDAGSLSLVVAQLEERLSTLGWSTGNARIESHNGQSFLYVNGLVNRLRQEAEELYALLADVSEQLPGSWGMLYERSDEFEDPNAFRVTVMARGVLTQAADPFLSPCNPVIED